MLSHRQQLRRWAAHVLLVWLFGIGGGIAHACLMPDPTGLASVAAAQADAVFAHDHDVAAHDASGHGQLAHPAHDGLPGHHGTLAKTNCQDFCSKASMSIPSLKSTLDTAQAQALIAAVFTTIALPMPALAPVQRWVPRQHHGQAPPIPIAFLRLAL